MSDRILCYHASLPSHVQAGVTWCIGRGGNGGKMVEYNLIDFCHR